VIYREPRLPTLIALHAAGWVFFCIAILRDAHHSDKTLAYVNGRSLMLFQK